MAIVVGVDGSPESRQALRWGLTEARLRQTSVRAVSAWQLPVAVRPTMAPLMPSGMNETVETDRDEDRRRRIEQQLDAVLAEVRRDLPEAAGVRIEQEAIEGHAAEVLVQAAADAELLVVGSRGHGGFAGLLLGSVSQACAHHARCPVVIVRPSPGDASSSGPALR